MAEIQTTGDRRILGYRYIPGLEKVVRKQMILKKAIRILLDKTWKPIILKYTAVDRRYHYNSLELLIKPGIFHPRFFKSTHNLLSYMETTELEGRTLLDLGTGSGILALYASQKGAIVTASDINIKAVQNASQNAAINNMSINFIHSDLFDNIAHQEYDVIVINPPYYPKDPETDNDYAWYCGEKFEYFQKLFTQLTSYQHPQSLIIISLADSCDIRKICSIANETKFELKLIDQKDFFWEKQLLFRVVKK